MMTMKRLTRSSSGIEVLVTLRLRKVCRTTFVVVFVVVVVAAVLLMVLFRKVGGLLVGFVFAALYVDIEST